MTVGNLVGKLFGKNMIGKVKEISYSSGLRDEPPHYTLDVLAGNKSIPIYYEGSFEKGKEPKKEDIVKVRILPRVLGEFFDTLGALLLGHKYTTNIVVIENKTS